MKRYYHKPVVIAVDEAVIAEIKAKANSTTCTPGCGGGTNTNCGSTSYCKSTQNAR